MISVFTIFALEIQRSCALYSQKSPKVVLDGGSRRVENNTVKELNNIHGLLLPIITIKLVENVDSDVYFDFPKPCWKNNVSK